jgi:hypothetical protein
MPRLTVSVIGDGLLDTMQMQPHEVAGDEEQKARTAYEVKRPLPVRYAAL